jgi:hypothetical protein
MNLKLPIFAASLGVVVLCLSQSALALYNPTQGRWLNRDPVSENRSLNRFAFVKNQPISHVDPHGLVELVSVGGSPALSPGGDYAFGAVWFTFSSLDFYALGGEGSLVWSRKQCFDIRPCNTIFGGFQSCRTMWFRKSFTLDIDGNITGGNLWDQNIDGTPSGQGLGLEVTGQSVPELMQIAGASDAVRKGVAACGSWGWMTAEVSWALLGGTLTGGSTEFNELWGFDRTTPRAENPPASWTDWSRAIAQGTLGMRVDWDQCVHPSTKSLRAWSSVSVTPNGPNYGNKRREEGEHGRWELQ